MTSSQKLTRISDILKVGWRNITGAQRREIFQLVGIALATEVKTTPQLVAPETLAKAKAIRKAVADYYNIQESLLWMVGNGSRRMNLARARHKAMALIVEACPSMSEECVGDLFNRDRGVVRWALQKVDAKELAELREKLKL